MKLHTQLNFGGNCEEAFKFYETHFGGTITMMVRAERVHALLSEGGEVYMPMAETFFATRVSMIRDRFGVAWSIINERARP